MSKQKDWKLVPLTAAEWRRRHLRGFPSRISTDPQVCRFVTRAFATMTFAQIVEACRKRFGAARAPSHSGVYRYWRTLLRVR